jgi:hypothetical protein
VIEGGIVTAGNASQLSDGSAAVVLMEAGVAAQKGLTPLGRYVGMAAAGTEPDEMGIGPVFAIPALLKRFGLKMDDIGLSLAERKSPGAQRLGRTLVAGMPKVLSWLSVIGTAAMLWVGGHILLAGSAELGWATPYHLVHQVEHLAHGVPVVGGVLGWVVNTLLSAILGTIVGAALVLIIERLPLRRAAAH